MSTDKLNYVRHYSIQAKDAFVPNDVLGTFSDNPSASAGFDLIFSFFDRHAIDKVDGKLFGDTHRRWQQDSTSEYQALLDITGVREPIRISLCGNVLDGDTRAEELTVGRGRGIQAIDKLRIVQARSMDELIGPTHMAYDLTNRKKQDEPISTVRLAALVMDELVVPLHEEANIGDSSQTRLRSV